MVSNTTTTWRFHLCPTALLLLASFACLASHTQAVDCRKFVFAPVCRGIIAKRMVSEKRSSSRPEASNNRQWNAQYDPVATDNEDEGLLFAQSYDDMASMDPHSRQEMVVVRSGSEVVQVPAYVYGVIERSLQGQRKK